MRSVLGIILFLFFVISLPGQTILFYENFDSCTLGPTWHYTLEGNQNVTWGVGKPTNPKAEGSTIDGTCFLYIDDDLTGDKTPPFKLRVYSDYFNGEGFSDISFQADVHFRVDKTEYMKIFIDNGKQEYPIRTFKNTNFNGVFFNQYLKMNTDISFYASDSMRIIIEYDDDNQWGWWAGIDNIVVTANQQGNIVMGQPFNDCLKPGDWQTEIVNGIDDWQFGIFHDGKSMDGSCFTFFNDDILGENAPLSKVRLFSPYFNGEEYGQYTLVYDLIFRTYEPNEYLQIYVDNGKEWIPVKTYNGDVGGPEIYEIVRETIDLSSFRNENIRLIWEYNDGGWAWWLGLDNVKVIGTGDINDKCNKAIPLIPGDECKVFDNTNALSTDEWNLNLPNSTGKIYYSWTPDQSASYLISTQSSFNDFIEIFKGTCDQPIAVTSRNHDEYGFKGEQIYLDVLTGESYIIRISGVKNEFGLDKGPGCIQVAQKSEQINTPGNEKCAGAIPLVENQQCILATNITAAMDGPLPIKNQRSRADVWFSFTPPLAGDYRFETQASFADVITVFQGSCDSLIENFSDYSGLYLDMKQLEADKLYLIQVTGYFSLLEGNICGKVTRKPFDSIPNPICSQAINLTVNGPGNVHSNHQKSFSGVRPACDVALANDVWFAFTAPASGKLFYRVVKNFPAIVALYEGECEELKSISCLKNKHHCSGYNHLEGLEPGQIYYIHVGSTIQDGTYKTGEFEITLLDSEPNFFPVSLTVATECKSRGAVLLTPSATGGKAPYTFYGLGMETVVSGNETYIIEVRDDEGCVFSIPVAAPSCLDFGCSLVSTITTMTNTCHGGVDGQAVIVSQGGLEPYTYLWSNGMTSRQSNSLTAGAYSVSITDASGCQITEDFVIYQPAKINANATFTTPTCFGETNGIIQTLVTGGNGNYTFLWSDGSSGSSLENIPGGNYSLTITDEKGCQHVEEWNLLQPAPYSVDNLNQHVSCPGGQDGSIQVNAKGGTGELSYLWSTGEASETAYNLKAGTYEVTITDENLCSLTREWTITQPDSFVMVLTEAKLVVTDTESANISFTLTGGTPPYYYIWYKNNVTFLHDTSSLITDETGEYHVVMTDAHQCTWSSPVWTVTKTSAADNPDFERITIRPNPTSRELYFDIPGSKMIEEIRIFDITGKLVWSLDEVWHETSLKIDLYMLPPGIYTLLWKSNGKDFQEKFVKSR